MKTTKNNLIKTEEITNKSDKIMVKIPIDPLNPLDIIVPIQINGYKWICKRGENIYLPKECVKLLEESGYLS